MADGRLSAGVTLNDMLVYVPGRSVDFSVETGGAQAMKTTMTTLVRALIIAGVWSAIGIGMNLISAMPVPWIYEPPKSLDLEGTKVLLLDEKEARELYGKPGTLFVDSRTHEDYAKSHVKGSVFLSPDEVQERFISVEPLLPQDSRIVLYCYGPECDMAERVAGFLVQMGYRNLAIMSAGFTAWEKAGYPVETAADRSEGPDFWNTEKKSRFGVRLRRFQTGLAKVGRSSMTENSEYVG